MTLFRPLLRVVAAVAMAAGAGQAVAWQSPARLTNHPYTSALSGFANYLSCGARARAREARALERALHETEAAARAKGLGPEMERVKRDYLALLAVSSRMACARGPAAALAGARAAMRAFRAWVAAAPVAGAAGHDRPRP